MNVLLAFSVLLAGWASQYGPGVMESVIRVRQAGRTAMTLPMELPETDGYVAMVECDRIGDVVYLRPLGDEVFESFLVVDCSGHAETTDWMERNNILVEVDYETALRWDTIGHGQQIEMKQADEYITFCAQ